jgi:asparagine synthase (glutamine-hydrolysing)
MCGIAGLLNFDRQLAADRGLLQAMCDVIHHRGPDSDGFHVDGEVGLGIRRLRIIDLATGDQPIRNEDGSVWVVFNGEIYNYPELRAALEARGHRFSTKSDTETIVHLYEDHGDDCVRHLRGMFGLALWDARRRRLLIARDRVGEKQLYYAVSDGMLTFGSEIKCLLQNPAQKRALDPRALRGYLTNLYVPGERTMFEGIRRLPPGHVLTVEGGRMDVRPYWRLVPRPSRTVREADVVEEFRHRFRECVRMRLLSDVPLGAFLSGGIDSSAIVATMAGLSSQPVKTFTIGYDVGGLAYDERADARVVADRFATEHHEFVVAPQVADVVPDVIRAFDEPFADSSVVPSWYICQLIRQHVTVALSGVGGDEVAAGYERYVGAMVAERYRRIPRVLRERLIDPLVRRLPDSREGHLTIGRAKRFVAGAGLDFPERYRHYVTWFAPADLDRLLGGGLAEAARLDPADDEVARALAAGPAGDPLAQMIHADLLTYLPDDLLVLGDRMSMAHSLEVRAPFLDHELLEFAATIPSHLKLRGMTKKYLLKQAFAPLLPAEVLTRKKKGFSIPLAVWFRGALKPFLLDWLGEARIKRLGVFDERAVAALIAEHMDHRENHENKLWALLMFVIWHALYMERA